MSPVFRFFGHQSTLFILGQSPRRQTLRICAICSQSRCGKGDREDARLSYRRQQDQVKLGQESMWVTQDLFRAYMLIHYLRQSCSGCCSSCSEYRYTAVHSSAYRPASRRWNDHRRASNGSPSKVHRARLLHRRWPDVGPGHKRDRKCFTQQ